MTDTIGDCGEDVPACLNRCVPAQGVGAECDPDPCIPDPLLCGGELACVNGRCVTQDEKDYLLCNPGQANEACPTGLVCRGFEDADAPYACAGHERLVLANGQEEDGACVLPQREGDACDSDFREAPGCAQCEPGTECLAAAGGGQRCFRRCPNGEEDCACTGAEPLYERCVDRSVNSDGSDLRCEPECRRTGEGCEVGVSVCCPTDVGPFADICNPAGQDCPLGLPCPPDTQGVCCRPTGGLCNGDAQCCDGGKCGRAPPELRPTCHVCSPVGTLADSVAGCCGSAMPNPATGICSVPCEEGAQCSPELCPSQDGTTACAPDGGTCVLTEAVTPEICDGKDNDCDGGTDEDVSFQPRSCVGGRVAADPLNDFPGCGDQEFPGSYRCINGEAVCVPQRGRDYCATRSDEAPYSQVGNLCFSGNAVCAAQAECTAIEDCLPDGTGDTRCMQIEGCGSRCWPVGQRADGSCP